MTSAFETAIKEHVDALLLPSAIANAYRREILDFTVNSRLPAIYENRESAELGGLIAYGPSGLDLWRRAAMYHRQDSERREAGRFARRAANEV